MPSKIGWTLVNKDSNELEIYCEGGVTDIPFARRKKDLSKIAAWWQRVVRVRVTWAEGGRR